MKEGPSLSWEMHTICAENGRICFNLNLCCKFYPKMILKKFCFSYKRSPLEGKMLHWTLYMEFFFSS